MPADAANKKTLPIRGATFDDACTELRDASIVVREGRFATVDLGPLVECHNGFARALATSAAESARASAEQSPCGAA